MGASPKGEDGKPYNEDDPPRKRPKMYSSDESKWTRGEEGHNVDNDAEREEPETFEDQDESKSTHGEEGHNIDNDAEREEPETFDDQDEGGEREDEDANKEKRKARQSFRSQQRPAMDSLVRLIPEDPRENSASLSFQLQQLFF